MFTLFRWRKPVETYQLLLLILCWITLSNAKASSILTLAEAERLALNQEPGVIAAQSRAKAMQEQSIAASALPNPELRVGVVNLPRSLDFNQEAMTQKLIGIRQTLPPAGSRKARREQLEYQSSAFSKQVEARIRRVQQSVREAWLETYYWQQAQNVVIENRNLFSHLVKVTRSIYSVGRKNQQDMVRAELEFSRLEDRLLLIDEQIRRSKAALGQWIGSSAAQRPLAQRLPEWHGFTDIQQLQKILPRHPLLLAADQYIASADAGIKLAKSKYKPALSIDLSYGERDKDLLGNPRDDFVSGLVTLSMPLFTGHRQDKDVSAALENRSAKQNDRDALLRKMSRELEAVFARWQQLQFRISLYNETIIEQSRIQAQATLQAYQSDTGDFADVMRAYITDLNTKLEFIRLQTDRAIVYAKLDYLVGSFKKEQNDV